MKINRNKIKTINEYRGDTKRGTIIWKYDDIKELIGELISYGISKTDISNKISSIINSFDEPEKLDLSYMTEQDKLSNDIENILIKMFNDAEIDVLESNDTIEFDVYTESKVNKVNESKKLANINKELTQHFSEIYTKYPELVDLDNVETNMKLDEDNHICINIKIQK